MFTRQKQHRKGHTHEQTIRHVTQKADEYRTNTKYSPTNALPVPFDMLLPWSLATVSAICIVWLLMLDAHAPADAHAQRIK